MNPFVIALLVILFLGIGPFMAMGLALYTVLLVRNRPEKWGRSCSAPDDAVSVGMFNEGVAWAEKHADAKKEVSITNDGLKLVGEYFDFGFGRAVIIIPGRMESLLYSYYFAEPYRAAGWNVLVTDQRAHGLSDGRINSVGTKEYRDTIAWAEYLHDVFGAEKIFLHGVCIGSSNALYAATSPKCPPYVCGMAAEGMYTTFCETFKNHMIKGGRKPFPMLYGVMLWILICSGANVVTDGPVKRIEKMKKPILFLHSREDIYSKPEVSKKIFEKCRSPHRVVWFEHGEHSRIRPVDSEKYDRSIADFLTEEGL